MREWEGLDHGGGKNILYYLEDGVGDHGAGIGMIWNRKGK
jgi:hypothetical protein